MAFKLGDYIDDYIQHADELDKRVALHLKEIIPKTTHLDKKIFKEITEKLKKEMESGENFKNAFLKIRKKYILTGDIIKAQLPDILTRIIVNTRLFVKYITSRLGLEVEDIQDIIESSDVNRFLRLIGHLELASPTANVVFATFDEDIPGNDPFSHYNVRDVIHMVGKDRRSFRKGEPLSAVKIRYRNKADIEKKFPIFLDAGWYDKFYPAKKNDNYGRTRSLDSSLKNMPEIVHENFIFSEVTENIDFLGE